MSKRKGIIALIATTVFITGCAKTMWVNPNVSNDQAQKDFAECQYDTVKHGHVDMWGTGVGAGIEEGLRKNEIMTTCMSSKGYSQQSQASQELTEQQNIKDRYILARAKFTKKANSINEDIINICRPKDDDGYIKCLTEKRNELVANAIFPDIAAKMIRAEEEFKQQLLRKEITRKEFKEYATNSQKPFEKQMAERVAGDIKAGIYTGKY